ncbi:MAG: response regulator [Spirochaetaceae bacterium]|nr:response regulator [Spirochaetaceae bacterium]
METNQAEFRPKVLVVDDFKTNVEYLRDFLEPEYETLTAYDGAEAIQRALDGRPDIVLLDVMMPRMDGYEVCRRFKADDRLKDIPIIFVTALGDEKDEAKAFEAGGSDFLTKPVKRVVVLKRIRTQLERSDQMRRLEAEVRKRTKEIEETRMRVIQCLGKASEYRDNETGHHVIRMSNFAERIALAYGLSAEEARLYLYATPMHDVGKIGIRDSILLKPGRLDEEELREMRRHCEIGEKILGETDSLLLATAAVCAKTHHERWDGKGYPQGLAGDAIPLVGRIAAVADVFDALTSKRPYKEAWPIARAAGEVRNAAGTQFDPTVVEAFQKALEEILVIRESYLED